MSLNNNTTSLQAILTTVNALPDKVDTSGTATAADIYTGKTATVNDAKLTGTNPYNAATVDPQVTDILAAIAEKGVDTTGKGLGDIAALVAAIESGELKSVTGTFTPANDVRTMSITHGLGKIPKFVFVSQNGSNSISSSGAVFYASIVGTPIWEAATFVEQGSTRYIYCRVFTEGENIGDFTRWSINATSAAPIYDATEQSIIVGYNNSNHYFISGRMYDYCMFA